MRIYTLIVILMFQLPVIAESNRCFHFYSPITMTKAKLAEVRAIFTEQNGVPKGTVDFVSSPLFQRFAMSSDVIQIANYLLENGPGKYINLEQGWFRELGKGEPGFTRMPFYSNAAGEVQGGYQIENGTIYVVVKGIAAYPNGENKLADGEIPSTTSRFFPKVIVASMISTYELLRQNPEIDRLMLGALGTVNGNVHEVLAEKLQFETRLSIPKNAAAAKINDYEDAIARGADPTALKIIPASDYFISINPKGKK